MSQPVRASLLSVGSSPPVVFLCSRLQACRGYDISVAWPEVSSKDDKYSVISDKFGSSSFQPDNVYNIFDLASIQPPKSLSRPHTKSLDPKMSHPKPGFDIVLISLSNLRQVSKISKSLASKIVPNHTIILLDTSSGLPPLQNLLAEKFPNNPVMSIIISDGCIFRTLSAKRCVVHKTSDTTLILDFSSLSLYATSRLVSDFLFNLQSSGIDIRKVQDNAAFLQDLWLRCIPTLAYGPLSIILDIADIAKLQQDILARPIYLGVIDELLELAHSQGCSLPNASYFSNLDLVKSLNMYNDFYNKLPIPIDVLLLQPILLADEFGLKSPYLESLFAFLSHLNVINSEEGRSALFQRVSGRSFDQDREEALWKKEQSLLAKEQELTHREHALALRESAAYMDRPAPVLGPGQVPGSHGPNSRRYRPPSALSSVAGSPPVTVMNVGMTNGFTNATNGRHANNFNGYNGNGMVPQTPNVASQGNVSSRADIDMMSMTNRRSRKSLVRSMSVASSLSTKPKSSAASPANHRMSSPTLSTMGLQPYSQNMDLDQVLLADDGRYGGLSNGLASKPRRLSSNFNGVPPALNYKPNGNTNGYMNGSVPVSRSNSLVMDNNALFSISPTAPANSRYTTAHSPDVLQINGHVNGNGNGNGSNQGYFKSSSSSSPSTTPSSGSK